MMVTQDGFRYKYIDILYISNNLKFSATGSPRASELEACDILAIDGVQLDTRHAYSAWAAGTLFKNIEISD